MNAKDESGSVSKKSRDSATLTHSWMGMRRSALVPEINDCHGRGMDEPTNQSRQNQATEQVVAEVWLQSWIRG